MGDFVNVYIGAPDGKTAVSLSSADKIHVSIAAGFTGSGGGGGGATNITITRTATTVTVNSDTGTDGTIAAADGTNAGVMTSAMQSKLAGIESGAEVNDSAAKILAKVVTVDGTGSGLDADLLDGNHASAFAAAVHTHAIGDVTGLQTALDSKVDENAAITGATKTKITYDSKGLVTAGADATTADIADSNDKRYVTEAEKTKLSNLSGTNTGDQNLFSTIAVSGQSNVVADDTGDTLTLVAGSNITITTDSSTDSITISSTGGGGGGDVTVLDIDNSTNGPVNTTTETALYSYTLPTDFAAGEVLQLTVAGTYQNTVSPRIFTNRVKIGGTTVLSHGPTVPASASIRVWSLTLIIYIENPANLQRCTIVGLVSGAVANGITTSLGVTNTPWNGSGVGDATIDLTTARTLELTVEIASASTGAYCYADSAQLIRYAAP